MVDEAAYPVLSGTTQASWAPIDLRFELLAGEADPGRIARVYVVPFVGDACVVVGFQHGDWGPVGGGREPGESVRAALERELAEEAGGRLLTYTPFALLRCHSRAPAPYRPHEPHPDFDCLYGYGEVELVGPPQLSDGPERTVAVGQVVDRGGGGRAAAHHAPACAPAGVRASHRLPQGRPLRPLPP